MSDTNNAADNKAGEQQNNKGDSQAKGEVRGTVLTADQVADWGNETRLVETPPLLEGQTGKQAEKKADDNDDDQAGAGDDQAAKADDDDKKGEKAAEVLKAPERQETPPPEDPGEFKPQDYSFTVTTYNEEGKQPKTHKITSVEDWDRLLEGEPNFGSGAELLRAQRQATKMENGIESDQKEYDSKKKAYDEWKKADEHREQSIATFQAEINYLVQKGELPPVAKEYDQADWSDPEVAKQPGVKEQIALLNFMATENEARKKAGLSPITSILDAFNSFKLEQAKSQSAAKEKTDAQQRKEAGSKVASTSSAPVSGGAPQGIAVGRGGSLKDLGSDSW